MSKPSFISRFRYGFDNIMARGTVALVLLLSLATFLVIFVIAILVEVFKIYPAGDPGLDLPFGEVLWGNLMRAMDAGTVAGDTGTGYRAFMLFITIFGIFVVACLIGIISGGFNTKIEQLRKGRSRVLESDHTLILGWSTKVFPIISEICIANESRGRAVIVVLADRDKVEMEDEIRAKIPKAGKTRIIVRSGDPMDLTDLELSSPRAARSIILLAPEGTDDPDSVVIKTALALTNNPNRRDGDYHIVGEIQDPANLEAARLVGKHEASWVLANDLISRVTVQTSRQSGLSVVYTELLDFGGDEIYFTEQESLEGQSYFETQLAFAEAAVMGIVTDGTVHINPPADTIYNKGDQLVVIAEDDSTIRIAGTGTVVNSAISTRVSPAPEPEQTLVLGYNDSLHAMLRELSEYVAPGSSVTIVADVDQPEFAEYPNLSITFTRGDTTSRTVLGQVPVVDFAHIIVLAYKETLDTQRADAKTLITLLHLREIADEAGLDPNVVSEMLDDRNRELAEVTKADDFIVSDQLISLMLSQMSENQKLNDVFTTLFSSEGSEIYLRPAELYIAPGSDVDFYTVLEAARRRGETAIGYRIAQHERSSAEQFGVRVNPRKATRLAFVPGDKIVVLAND